MIILDYDNNLRIFSDAAGFRQVFYTKDSSKGIWCVSQPGIIAEQLNLDFDKDIVNNFMNSPFFKNNPEYWYPGDSSSFKEIIHLLPNHYLDLNTGKSVRYWPTNKQNTLSLEECVEKSSDLLKGLIESAYHRFDLALAISAGVDSRVLLAASKEFSEHILYFTQTHQNLTEKGMDIVVPAKLLPKLSLKHKIIKCPSNMDDEFKNKFKRNVTTARLDKGLIIYCSYKCFNPEKVQINGNVSGIAKCCYRLSKLSKVSGETLAKFAEMGKNTFAIKQFEKWLSTTEGIEKRYGINILDLFFWEQREGNWAAMTFTEADIANETFTPYNCRCLLTTLLSVEEKHRMKPKYELYKKLIMHMWPETLELPINPQPFKDRVKRLLKLLLYPGQRIRHELGR